jgi:hypothetical protein
MAKTLFSCSCAFLGILSAACSGGENGGEQAHPEGLEAPAGESGVQLRQSFALERGKEVHYCQYYVLPERAVDVARFEHSYTDGGHHIILYPTDLSPEEIADHPSVFDCNEVPNRGDRGFAYVGGRREAELAYPPGTAWRFRPGQIVMLESHMLNVTSSELDVDYRLNLWYATEAVTAGVGTIFFYDNQIYIPEQGRYTANMRCQVPADIQVLSLTPHMHVRGTSFRTRLVGRPEGPLELVGSEDWANTDPTTYEPPLEVAAGQRFEFSCDYENPDTRPIIEGPSKTDNEMCLLTGSYYPKLDFQFEFCMEPGSGPLLDGSQTCGESFGCFVSNGADPVAAEKCATSTCAGSSQAFNDFFACAAQNCFFPGKCNGPNGCQACTLESCAAEIGACQAAGCE